MRWLSEVGQDARFALRILERDRSFALTVLLTVVICVAGNAAIFGVVRSVVLEPLPVPAADRIVLVSNLYPKAGFAAAGPDVVAAAVPDYYDRAEQIRAFEDVAMYRRADVTVGGAEGPQRAPALRATPSFYRIVGARPLSGRIFTDPGDGAVADEVLLSHAFWQTQYGADPELRQGHPVERRACARHRHPSA